MVDYEIVDMADLDGDAQAACARLLFEGSKDSAPSWLPTLDDAERVTGWALQTSRDGPRLCRVAVDETGGVLGWVAATMESRAAWELHPIVVTASLRKTGIGRALIEDLEGLIRERGAQTLFLSTDDELGRTSLSKVDLLPDVLAHLQDVTVDPLHPVGFYWRLGFTITGVVPDDEGPGNPSIVLAKHV